MALPSTAGRSWCAVLCALLDQAGHAAIVVDMAVPMLPILHANQPFAALTGWGVEEAVGQNCRFLQCPQTEPQALDTLISCVRQRTSCRVRITNARKDGATFLNDFSMHAVHDTNGGCKYSIGMLADASAGTSSGLEALRAALPTRFEASLQPKPPSKFVPVDPLAQWKEFQPQTSKMMRMLWSTDPDGALRRFLTLPSIMSQPAIASLGSFLSSKSPEDERLLEGLVQRQREGTWSAMAGRTDKGSAPPAARPTVATVATPPANLTSEEMRAEAERSGRWDAMHQLLQSSGAAVEADGAAASHQRAAREAAARKLISNHANVLLDLTNASETLNIEGRPLTQQFVLRRVAPADRSFADEFLLELARRLLGRCSSVSWRVELGSARAASVWMMASKYLDGRIQSTPDQKPGRTPDVSVEAAAAMKAVMAEMQASAAAMI